MDMLHKMAEQLLQKLCLIAIYLALTQLNNGHANTSETTNIPLIPECPEGKFGIGCVLDCHCPEGDVCDSTNGLCESGHCSHEWTGASCLIRHPVLQDAPQVTASTWEGQCVYRVEWPEWNQNRDVGDGPIGSYTLEVHYGGQEWNAVGTYGAGKSFYLSTQYLIPKQSRDKPHSFRIILGRLSDDKILPSIAGIESQPLLNEYCEEHDLSEMPSDIGSTPEIIVTLTYDEDSTINISLNTDNKSLDDTLIMVEVTQITTYVQNNEPLWFAFKVTEGLTHRLDMLPSGTQYRLQVNYDQHTSIGTTFWTSPTQPLMVDPPTIIYTRNSSMTIRIYVLDGEKSSGGSPISSYTVIVEDRSIEASILFGNIYESFKFDAKPFTAILSDTTHGKRKRRNDEDPWSLNETTNFHVAAVFPGNMTESRTFTVGDGKIYGGYENTALKPSHKYIVWLAVSSTLGSVTRRSFSASPQTASLGDTLFVTNSDTAKSGSSQILTIMLVLLALILLGVAVLVYLLWRRKRAKKYFVYSDYPRREPPNFPSSPSPEEYTCSLESDQNLSRNRKLFHSCDILDLVRNSPLCQKREPSPEYVIVKESNPIPVKNLSYWIKQDSNGYTLADEFRHLPAKKQGEIHVALHPQNTMYNRSADVVPYDRNRVKLVCTANNSTSLYINASTVQCIDPTEYIVTQAPMSATIHHFWHMVWEQEAGCVVMLMHIREKGKPDCEQYWPSSGATVEFGDLIVQSVNEEKTAHYIIRDLKIIQKKTGMLRELTHFQYITWTRWGLPPHTLPYVDFVRRVQEERDRGLGTVVHCHAGGGRSGVFIALDSLITQGKLTSKVDVLKCVTKLRMERPNLVKTFKQYCFIYQSLADVFDHPESRISGERFSFAFDNLLNVCTPNQMSALTKEYDDLRVLQLQQQNVKYNVTGCSAFGETTLFHSPKKPGMSNSLNQSVSLFAPEESSSYNCDPFHKKPHLIDTFRHRECIKVAQYPSESETNEFWDLILTEKIRCIVDLNIDFSATFLSDIFPTNQQPVYHGAYKITVHDNDSDTCESYTIQDFLIAALHPDMNDDCWFVRVYKWEGWPSDKVTPAVRGMMELLDVVRRWCDGCAEYPKVLVLGCQEGRAALFSLLWSLSERLEDEWLVDVYSATKYLQVFVPRAVSNLEQYRFLYLMMRECVKRITGRRHQISVGTSLSRRTSSRYSRSFAST